MDYAAFSDYSLINCSLFQSLLSSPYISKDTLQYVLSEVTGSPNLRGQGSLRVLCMALLRPMDAIDALIAEFPNALPHFAREMFGTEVGLVRRQFSN